MSGDRARGDWSPWPVVAGQLELPVPEEDKVLLDDLFRQPPDQGEC